MTWRLSWRADPMGAALADRHYNRQRVGAKQFVPPGRCVVLVADPSAVWVTSWPFAEHVKHAWAGAWVNSLFRNEGAGLSSEMIRGAVAATRAAARSLPSWAGEPEPALGLVTFIDSSKVRGPVYGSCYRAAGFRRERCCCPPGRLSGPAERDMTPPRCDGGVCNGRTTEGLLAFRLRLDDMPPPEAAPERRPGARSRSGPRRDESIGSDRTGSNKVAK